MRSFITGGLVVVLAAVLSALVIRASDGILVPGSGLLASLGGATPAPCPRDMVYVDLSGGGLCVDRFEASTADTCPIREPRSFADTEANIGVSDCLPRSKEGVRPWTNIPQHQAELLCARVGKRLPSNQEWYRAAMGTQDDPSAGCVLGRSGASRAEPSNPERCRSSSGAFDMVGNVWEWVSETVEDGKYKEKQLPDEGYIIEVTADGIASKTALTPDPSFASDQFFIDREGIRGMMRGGFWGMSEKAGIYALSSAVAPTFTGEAIGFRCVRSSGI